MRRALLFFVATYIFNKQYIKGASMKTLLLLIGIVAVWYILNRWVLPRFGVQT